MAAASGHHAQDRDEELEVGSDPHQHDEDYSRDREDDDGTYREVTATQQVPTKTGEEDEMQLDSDRPGTAGTGHSTQLSEGDAEVLASNTAAVSSTALTIKPPPFKVNLLTRPDHVTQAVENPGFSFGKAIKPSFDFMGKHAVQSSQTAHVQSTPVQPHDATANGSTTDRDDIYLGAGVPAQPEPSLEAQPDIPPMPQPVCPAVHSQVAQSVSSPVDQSVAQAVAPPVDQPVAQPVGQEVAQCFRGVADQPLDGSPVHSAPFHAKDIQPGLRHRLKRHHVKRQRQRPSIPLMQAGHAGPVSSTAEPATPPQDSSPVYEPSQTSHVQQHKASQLHESKVLPRSAPKVRSPVNDGQARPLKLTQDKAPTQIEPQAHARSPHSQLQEDLQNTVQQDHVDDSAIDMNVDNVGNLPVQSGALFETITQHTPQAEPGCAGTPLVARASTQTSVPTKQSAAQKSTTSARQTARPAPNASNRSAVSNSDIDDYMQILIYKVREQSQQHIDAIASERDAMQQTLDQRLQTTQVLEAQLSRAQQDRNGLSVAFDKQKMQLKAYEAKVKKFKTFVDGLGRDVDSLKRDANANRRRSEELIKEGDDRRAERVRLVDQMNACTERSSQLKSEALKMCSETQSELQAATMRATYLDAQLGEKVGLLAEERDRRAQLERQLLSVSSSSEGVVQAIKKSHDTVLDKLHVMHAAMESAETGNRISEMLKQTLEAVQAVDAQATNNAEEAALTQGLIEALDEKLSELQGQDVTEPLKKQLDGVSTALKGLADHESSRLRQETAHNEAVSSLHEQIRASNARITTAETDLQLAQGRERELRDENQRLEGRLAAAPNVHQTPSGASQSQVDEARLELQTKMRALEVANSDVRTKAAELDVLKRANKDFETTIKSLQQKIQQLEETRDRLLPAKEVAEEQARNDIERVRAESLKHSETFRAQLDMDHKNQIKKLTSDRDRYEKQLHPLKAELTDVKKQREDLQRELAEAGTVKHDLDQSRKTVSMQSQDINSLKTSLHDLQQSANIDASLKEKLQGLTTDLETANAKLEETMQEKASLQQKADEYLSASTEANENCEEVKAELAAYRADTTTQIEKLQQELNNAQEAHRRIEAGQEHFRKSCDAAIEDEAAKGRRKVEDLQTRLAQADAELQKEKTDAETFRAEMDKQWQLEKTEHAQKLDGLRGQVEQANTVRDEALASNERSVEERHSLLEQVNDLKQQLMSAEDNLRKQEEAQTQASQAAEASRRFTVPNLNQGLTPTEATAESTQPARPRKRVDRNNNSTIDASAVPVPEALRPMSRRVESSTDKPSDAEAVIEDSQNTETQVSARAGISGLALLDDSQATETQFSARHRLGGLTLFSDNNDPTQIARDLRTQGSTQVVEKTQLDNLPSFESFTQSLSHTQAPGHSRPSSSLSSAIDYDHEADLNIPLLRSQDRLIGASGRASTERSIGVPVNSFTIHEDGQEIENQAPTVEHPGTSQQPNAALSQEERDRFTYRKPMPLSNSASKMVRNASQTSNNGKPPASSLQMCVPLGERRLQTPEARGEAVYPSRVNTAHSSSPAYVQPASSRPTRTYTNTPGVLRHPSRTQDNTSQDPRLIGRSHPPAPKRKAESSVTAGYESERKKRLSAAPTSSADQTRFNLRSQQSINDLPAVPAMTSGQRAQSRLRTFGGSSARAPGSRKVSKADEYGARFSQELNRR